MTSVDSHTREPEWTQATLTVFGAHGLHARPAIRFSRAARAYASKIQICIEGGRNWVDAKSVAKVMGLQVESGKTILLRAFGADADAALAGLRKLVEIDMAADDEDKG